MVLPTPGWLRDWNLRRLQARRQRRAERIGETLDYAEWVARHDTMDDRLRRILRQRGAALGDGPLLSVLMPVHDPEPAWLDDAIASVRAQLYPRWELCIADDRSTDPRVREVLSRHAGADHRIRIEWRARNGHISAASNSALALARGDYVALLDHDDRLPEHALLCVAETIARFPDAAVVYSDEDKLDAAGRRCDPYFKCDWNLELFRGQNLVSHLGVYRTDLVRAVGGFREGYEGSQDYDLALRCIERVAPRNIVHIPHVLYHWRIHAGSTAANASAKPYASRAGARALAEHFERTGIGCDVAAGPAGWYRCEYRLPHTPPAVTIVVADTGGGRCLRRCLAALGATDYPRFDIVVASPRKRVTVPDACNIAIANTGAEFIALVDSHCRQRSSDWLGRLVARASLEGAGAVGAKLLAGRGRIVGNAQLVGARGTYAPLSEGVRTPRGGYCGRALLAQDVAALGNGCVVVRRAGLTHVGWLDPSLRDLGAALVDLTYKLNAYGRRNQWDPQVEFDLVRGGLRGRNASIEAERVAQRWGFATLRDGHYNDNLGPAGLFHLARQPRVGLETPWFESVAMSGVFASASKRIHGRDPDWNS